MIFVEYLGFGFRIALAERADRAVLFQTPEKAYFLPPEIARELAAALIHAAENSERRKP